MAGVSIATLRYYERRGLIPAPSRTPSGYRAFEPDTVKTVRVIKGAQALGFTLREIQALLSLCNSETATSLQLNEFVKDKLSDLDRELDALSRQRSTLAEIVADDRPDERCANDSELLERLAEVGQAAAETPGNSHDSEPG